MNNIVFLDENDFKREVSILSNSITKNIIQQLPIEQTKTTNSKDNFFIKHIQEGTIQYSLATYIFTGKFTEADKQYLYDIGARWSKERRGYYLHYYKLTDDLKKTIENNIYKRQSFFANLQQKQQTLINYQLSSNEKTIIDNIIKILLLRMAKHYFLKTNKLELLNDIILTNYIMMNIRQAISTKIAITLKKENKNNVSINAVQQQLINALSIGIYDAIGFSIRQLLFSQQQQIAKSLFKSTLFRWIHRDPPQPQDRIVHIKWWKSKRIFDFTKPPINPETNRPDLPGLLIHCHCKAKLIY